LLCRAIIRITTPLASILLRNGVSFGLYSEMAKRAFIEAAEGIQKSENKRVTGTNSAVLTGLTRKDVKRISETPLSSIDQHSDKYNRAVKVISGWINDSRYYDLSGTPASLSFNGDGYNFSTLVKEYSGDMGARAMLNVLEEAKCIAVTFESGIETVTLIKHAYVPQKAPETAINILGTDVGELVQTIEHNLRCDSSEDKWFQRKVSTYQLDQQHVARFKRIAFSKSQTLLEDLDQWLTEHEAPDEAESQYVSLGIFYSQADSQIESDDNNSIAETSQTDSRSK
jgi:hypothetical protein